MGIFDGFTIEQLNEIAEENPVFEGFNMGYLAEYKFKEQLKEIPEVTSVTKIPDRNPEKGDYKVIYKEVAIKLECKSIGKKTIKKDWLNDTWEGRVCSKNSNPSEKTADGVTMTSAHLIRGQFDILAISCYAVNQDWDQFLFMENQHIPARSPQTPNFLKTSFIINPQTTPCLSSDLHFMIESVYQKKSTGTAKI